MTKGAAAAAPDLVVLDREVAAGRIVRGALAVSVRRLARAEPAARAGRDPEGVHRMRVATRRLRSDLRTFEGVLDADWAESLRTELRWVARALGGSRESDVLRARLGERLAAPRAIGPDPAEPIRAALRREADAAADVLRAALASDRYVALRARLEAAAADPRFGPERDLPAMRALAPRVHRRFRALRREVRAAGSRPSDAALHAIRIRAKRARYAAEALAPVGGPDVVRFAAAAKRLQAVLGAHQDAVAAADWLAAWADGTGGRAAGIELARRLAAAERLEAAAARERWAPAWRRLDDPALRGWM
ncbi:MAG TPA: CHAD domain-containing protein [Actinomycetota bacterium]|nr:CHAD domain-containing protein [Actinomycetota bacterium]